MIEIVIRFEEMLHDGRRHVGVSVEARGAATATDLEKQHASAANQMLRGPHGLMAVSRKISGEIAAYGTGMAPWSKEQEQEQEKKNTEQQP